jgi:hypothetical protein
MRVRKRYTRKRGGKLIVENGYLINNEVCRPFVKQFLRSSVRQITPAEEIYTATDSAMELKYGDDISRQRFFTEFKRGNINTWFKFVIFNNSGNFHLFIIKGSDINKHTVPLVQGILEVAKHPEYSDLRTAYEKVMSLKKTQSINSEEIHRHPHIIELDNKIKANLGCLEVVSAGSGTLNNDGSICINPKSGHYHPTKAVLELAKIMIQTIVGLPVNIKDKMTNANLTQKFGTTKNLKGLCIL